MAVDTALGINLPFPYSGSVIDNEYGLAQVARYARLSDDFSRIRIVADFTGSDTYPAQYTPAKQTWLSALKTHNPNVYMFYGHACNPTFKPRYYNNIMSYLLEDAAWAQANDVDAYCVGNENLISSVHGTTHGMLASSVVRTSNVVTATFAFDHGFTTGDYIFVYGATPSTINITDSESTETVQCTVVNATTITYPATGVDGTATGTIYIDWSAKEVVRKQLAIWSACAAIFTNGPTIYSESQGHTPPWIAVSSSLPSNALIALNGYGNGDNNAGFVYWKNEVDGMFAEFGTDFVITEFNVVQEAPDNRKVNNMTYTSRAFEKASSEELRRRYKYLKSVGITQIYLFSGWYGNGINATMSFNFLCNTAPYGWNDSTTRHLDLTPMPIIEILHGNRPAYAFFGSCTNI